MYQLLEAIRQYAKERSLTVFRRDPEKGLWIPGNNLKACLKEAASIAANSGRLPEKTFYGVGRLKKAIKAWLPEHLWVTERRLYLGKQSEGYVAQSFPKLQNRIAGGPSRAIKYTEVCEDVTIDFTIGVDWEISDDHWGAIWTTAERIGLGADRSHFGQFEVTKWERTKANRKQVMQPPKEEEALTV